MECAGSIKQLNPVPPGHADVRDDDIDRVSTQQIKRLPSVGCGDHLITFALKTECERLAKTGLIVNQEYPCILRTLRVLGHCVSLSGSVMRNRVLRTPESNVRVPP